jgi:hypothetical protein
MQEDEVGAAEVMAAAADISAAAADISAVAAAISAGAAGISAGAGILVAAGILAALGSGAAECVSAVRISAVPALAAGPGDRGLRRDPVFAVSARLPLAAVRIGPPAALQR